MSISWQGRLINLYLRNVVKRRLARLDRIDAGAVRGSRERLRRLERWLPAPPAGARIDPIDEGTVRGELLSAPGSMPDTMVLFLHGGAYTVGSPRIYRDLAMRISAAAGSGVLVLDYRLAPEHRFPAPLEDALAAWRWLIARGHAPARMVIAGDSAGGGLALATLLALRDAGAPLPAAALCMAPWTDLTCTGESLIDNDRRDPYLVGRLVPLAAAHYLAGHPADDPRASPLLGALEGLPPVCIHAGALDVVLDDSRRFASRARAAGVPVHLQVWPGMPHVFELFAPALPEARRSIRELGAFARRALEATA